MGNPNEKQLLQIDIQGLPNT